MIRRPRPDGDDGYALIFVMLVTLLITIATGTMIAIAADNISSARRSQQSETALALADAGLQDYVANLNAHCVSYSVNACPWLEAQQSTPLTATLASGSYAAKAQSWHDYLSQNNGVVRVSSTGTTGTGTAAVTKTLVADISGEPSVLRFAYFSDYETIGSALLSTYYPAGSFTVSGAAASAAGITSGSTVHWNGASSTPSNNYTDSVCDQLYYSTPGSAQQGRYQIKQARPSLPLGRDFAEDGTVTPPLGTASPVTQYGTCEVTFSKGMSFDGPVYTRDAPYLSNGATGSITGPSFVVAGGEPLPAASTAWSTSDTPAADSANPYRSFPLVGGAPAVANSVKTLPFDLSLPSSVSGADSSATVCTGDTTIVLSGSTATLSGGGSSCAGHVVSVDLTTISVHGTASIQGNLTSGRLSLVATQDIDVTGDVTTPCVPSGQICQGTNEFGEPSWTSGPAIDLVALGNVRVDHGVKCAATGNAPQSSGYCANDITGLYTTDQASAVVNSDGSLKSVHPAMQYTNNATGNREIDAAIFALTGSFYTQNFNRGAALGTLTVKGGIYQNHRGPLGQEWELTSTTSSRAYSGYKLALNYVSYQTASLPYVPALQGGTPDSPWQIIAVSSPTAGGS